MHKSLTRDEVGQDLSQSIQHWVELGARKPANTPTSTEVLLRHQGSSIVSKTKKMDFRACFWVWGITWCEARERKRQLARPSLPGATSAGRQGTAPTLAGGKPAPSSNSTNRRKLGATSAERSSFKETMGTNLLLTGWLPPQVSWAASRKVSRHSAKTKA